ncbi:glycosyltransferase [Pelagibacterales bacterium SAG-MED15]|nr:glycosyltransferase [Pelagibacterales bacterium SAG-MED15]
MNKVFYWSPHLSNVATIKNVINSAKSIKKFNKNVSNISIIDAIGEWRDYLNDLKFENIDLIKLSNFNLKKYLPVNGFLKSRIVFFLIFLTKYFPLKKLLEKEKPDYLIIHLVTILPLILLLTYKSDTKFILRISGLPKLTFFRKFFWKLISKKIYLVTCPSKQTKFDLIKKKIFDEKKIKILFDPIIEPNLMRQKLKETLDNEIYNEKNYFLNIGRLTNQKNQKLLINAFAKIVPKKENLKLIIAGEGEEEENLIRQIKTLGLEKHVILPGYVKNIYPLINKSLAIICTSLWEDPGAVMVESAYLDKIVISSNCPNGPEEFLENGKAGYLFKNNDERDLIYTINNFFNDSDLNKKQKCLNAKKNSKNYTVFSHFKKINELLHLN